jgi:hypothetical protein
MRTRIVVMLCSLFSVAGVTAVATPGDISGGPARQWAIAYLAEPTLVGSTIVQGPVLFLHDTVKMARGEPCTSVQLFDPEKGPLEQIAEFHCIPLRRTIARTFTMRTRPNTELGFGCVLTEYQFAGDSEGHAVPIAASAH